ncbi:golgin subfamily A member 8C-like isoform X3 [Trachypithecus francoisi]|uniref:golgin subfamily A member 8C-like isoform X3 n=1 Tax=Trachypithecus francoisi TaxID=54180 RepID=UPI00141BA12E|nr:golgin subfamily A member 8C-like isoform X3 [Trachypithecus francoisi]
MLEETRERKLAAAKKKLKEHWQRNSPGAPAGVNKNRKTNGSSPETATSGGCHSTGALPHSSSTSSSLYAPQSRSQELAAVLDSRPVKISLLKNTIKSLKQEKKQVEHQLEEEKKANSEKQKAERKLEVQVQRLNIQKGKLSTHLYHQKRSLRYLEEESKDLAGRLQHSLQHKGELKRALSAITTTQKKDDRSSSHRKAHMEWKLEWSIREQALLKAQLTQMKYSLKQVQLERDEYAQHLKGERARWQERMRKMLQEVCTLKKEKKDVTHWVEKLERSLSKLKNQTAEPLPREPPAVPPEEELQHLRKELERVSAELQAQVENHQHVSLLNQAQKERLQEQEERLQEQEEKLRKQEERLREQEERLQQLAKPQSGVEELNNENKSALQLEQQVEELQEKLGKRLAHPVASAQKEPEATVPAPGTGGESSGFMGHREEMADLSELVKKQELRFIHYRRERCHQNVHHLTIEAGGSAKDAAMGGGHHQAGPAQGGDEGESAGAAGDAVTACADHNSEHSKLLTSAQNPADEPGPGAPAPQELGAAKQHGDLCEVSLTDSSEPVQGEAREGSPYDNPTAQPIMQDHQEHPGLGSNCFVPFLSCAWLRRRRR